LHTLPSGEFRYADWNDNFNYSARLFGENELEYISKAGIASTGVDLSTNYTIDHVAEILPGLDITFDGSYIYQSYNFYGSLNPGLSRVTNNGKILLSLSSFYNTNFNFGLNFGDHYYLQKDDDVNENTISTNGFMRFGYNGFDIRLDGTYKNQSVDVPNLDIGNQYYYSAEARIGFKFYELINLQAGIHISESEGNSFFSPIAYGSLKLNKNTTLFAEFLPNTEFFTLKDFNNLNRYYKFSGFVNQFVENKFKFKAAIKYEYEKYFEISGGAGYINSDNNLYFDDLEEKGLFKVKNTDTEKSFVFMNFLFRKGPYGEFYGDVILQQLTATKDKELPYSPNLFGSFNYAYNLNKNFRTILALNYFGKSYSDLANSNKLPEGINISVQLKYEIFDKFKLTLNLKNLLNDKYFYFRNYQAKPLDILAGFEFRW